MTLGVGSVSNGGVNGQTYHREEKNVFSTGVEAISSILGREYQIRKKDVKS